MAAIDNLHFVEVPGYREVLKREAQIRDAAFLPDFTEICGIPVRRMTGWHLNALTAVRNGFVVSCIFDDELERAEHACQLIWCVSQGYELPKAGFWHRWTQALRKSMLAYRLARKPALDVYQGIADYLEEAFYDGPKCPKGSEKSYRAPLHTSWLAIIMDDLAGAGYMISPDEVLQMPLSRLWQFHRRAQKRLYKEAVSLANPSDRWFMEHKDDPKPAQEAKS